MDRYGASGGDPPGAHVARRDDQGLPEQRGEAGCRTAARRSDHHRHQSAPPVLTLATHDRSWHTCHVKLGSHRREPCGGTSRRAVGSEELTSEAARWSGFQHFPDSGSHSRCLPSRSLPLFCSSEWRPWSRSGIQLLAVDPRLTKSSSCCWKQRGDRTGGDGSTRTQEDGAAFWIFVDKAIDAAWSVQSSLLLRKTR